jgi:hypothetical protein
MRAKPSSTNIATGLAELASALWLLLGGRFPRSRRSHSNVPGPAFVFLLALLAFSVTPSSPSYAATLTVCTSGCGYTSIAVAIAAANPGDTISIQDAVHSEVNIEVDRNLTIQGQGAANTLVDGGGKGTVFLIHIGVTATIQDMTISHGSDIFGFGGAINNSGTVTINNSTLSDNSAIFFGSGGGGGIYNNGIVEISNSTLSGNFADGAGGGIFNAGALTISNSTLSGNSAGFAGGGIFNFDTVTISNSTLSGNSATFGGGIYNAGTTTVKNSIVGNSASGGDCNGTITALGTNLDTDGSCGSTNFTSAQLNLGPLMLNAPGTTATQALLPNSPAIDAAVDCTDVSGAHVTTDQRGVARPDKGESACDIGAYESACSVTYNGTFNGNLTISSGLTCIFGTVTGNVSQNGGGLLTSNATIGGNLQITGGGTFSIAGTAINGDLQIQNIPAGSAQNQICGTHIKGNLQVHNNGTAVAMGTTSASCPGNTISKNLQINNNLALVQVFDDKVGGNLQCQGNASITGGGDTAKSLQGQCAGF